MKFTRIFSFCSALSLFLLPSCMGDSYSANDYSEWRERNEAYINGLEKETENGELVYDKVVATWDNSVYVLMRWHNDRAETINKLTPLSNSTVTLNYTLTTIEGDTIDKGAGFSCRPNNMVTGFWTAVTNMNEGDTVTAIVPSNAGYGAYSSGGVLPYSTLIFGIKLVSIDKLF